MVVSQKSIVVKIKQISLISVVSQKRMVVKPNRKDFDDFGG